MIDWLAANWVNILVIALVAVMVFFDKKAGKSSCGCNCSHCALAGKCHSQNKK